MAANIYVILGNSAAPELLILTWACVAAIAAIGIWVYAILVLLVGMAVIVALQVITVLIPARINVVLMNMAIVQVIVVRENVVMIRNVVNMDMSV